jgi:hypothetical protein
LEDAANLSGSNLSGFYSITGAAHAAGWISKIPESHQAVLEADYIVGFASNYPINTRNSIGPTAFTLNIDDVVNATPDSLISAEPLMDFSLANMIHPDRYNLEGNNDIWTEVSMAKYGFIIPNTKTYMVIGSSGGHESSIGYKIIQDTGHECAGPCPYVAADYQSFVWLFNVDDLLSVKNGDKLPHEVMPYSYGEIPIPFQPPTTTEYPNLISGADYNYTDNKLYLVIDRADRLSTQDEKAPIVLVYNINLGGN